MLIHFGVVPYLVFDGDYLPSKAATEVGRAKRREESKKLGLELHKLGKMSQAHLELQKAVDVTPEMARQFIEELKQVGVQYVVAPYEADAQLVYLERKGIIDGILSEDSDLLVFGAKCLLTKLDQYGDCVEINRDDFTACREISLVGWTDEEFRRMAILSGCDYLASINKMGLKTAYRLVRKHKTIEKIVRMLQLEGQYRVPPGYLEAFRQAELTFLHQRVFCPLANTLVLGTDLDDGMREEDLPFIGGYVERDIAVGVTRGDLHPMTKSELLFARPRKDTPKTHWKSSSRKQTPSAVSDLKPKKLIDSFFKPKRIPLAELDPNSFTPSPTQQRLLQRGASSWSSSPAPSRPSVARAPTTPSASGLPTPESQRATLQRVNNRPKPPTAVATHPSKRQRLCWDAADEAIVSQARLTESERSRYFASSVSDPSPSVRKGGPRKQPRKADMNIWSDDSIDGVMAGLPDISDFPQPVQRGKLNIFADETPQGPGQQALSSRVDNLDSEKSVTATMTPPSTTVISGAKADQDKAQEPGDSSHTSQPFPRTLGDDTLAELKALRGRSFHQAPQHRRTDKGTNEQHGMAVFPKKLAVSNESRHSSFQQTTVRRVTTTPLQRFAASALRNTSDSRARQPTSTHSATPALASKTPQPISTLSIVNISSTNTTLETSALHPKGSEDMIVPDSENESDGDDRSRPRLDLGRFAFHAT